MKADKRCAERNALVLALAALRRAIAADDDDLVAVATSRLVRWSAEQSTDGLVPPNWLADMPDGGRLSEALLDAATRPASPVDGASLSAVEELAERIELIFAEWRADSSVTGTCLPVGVTERGSGHLVSLGVDLAVTDVAHAETQGFGPRTVAAVEAARAEVEDLLDLLGRSGAVGVELALTGDHLDADLDDDELALPVALGALAHFVPWSGSRVELVAAGALVDGAFAPLPEAEVKRRREAASDLGLGLVVPTATGWQLWHVGQEEPVVFETGDRSLEAAAGVLWGRKWADWAAGRRSMVLERLRFTTVDLEEDPNQAVPDTRIEQVGYLERMFAARPTATVMIGGPTSTGKSTIIRMVAKSLREQGWKVVAVSPNNGRLPDEDLIVQVARTALLGGDAQHHMLVLENIIPVGQAQDADVDTLLRDVSTRLGIGVLAALQYEIRAASWRTDETSVTHAVVGQSHTLSFAKTLTAANEELLGGARPHLADLVRKYHRDLRRLTNAMRTAAQAGPGRPAGDDLDATIRGLGENGHDALRKLAAVSLLNNEVLLEDLWPLDEDVLSAAGGVSSTRHNGWRLASPDLCRDILSHGRNRHDGGGRHAGADRPGGDRRDDDAMSHEVVRLVTLELAHVMKQQPSRVVTFLRCCRQADETVCRKLLEDSRFKDNFELWLEQVEVQAISELVVVGDGILPYHLQQQLASKLVNRCQELASASVGDMQLVLRALWHVRSDVQADLNACLESLVPELTRLFASVEERRGRGAHRLLDSLLRFQYPGFNRLVAERGLAVLQGLNPDIVQDYSTARRVDRLVKQAGRHAQIEVDLTVEEPSVRKLLDHHVPARRGLPLILAWLTLKLGLEHIEDWDAWLRRHSQDIASSLRYTDVQELRYAIADLHACNPAFCVRLLNSVPHLNARLRTLIGKNALAVESALLLQTLTSRHARLAFEVLYQDSSPANASGQNTPRKSLAKDLASVIIDTGDNKGAGMLLAAAYQLDDWKGNPATGFAHELAQQLGEEWFLAQVANDVRPSVVSHLIKGMWRARTTFADRVLDAAVESVANSIRSTLRPWGPQLALIIAEDPEVARDFIDRLRLEVRLARILEGMTKAGSTDARTFFHRLGRILHPEAASAYLAQYRQDGVVLRGSINASLNHVLEVGKTLRLAGADEASSAVFEAARKLKGKSRFLAQLNAFMSPSELAESIRLMTRLDPLYTAGEVDRLSTTIGRDAAGRERNVLADRVRYGMNFDHLGAANLMEASERVAEGVGQRLLASALKDQQTWKWFANEVQHLQNPTQQWTVARHLHAVGLRYGTRHTSWMEKAFDIRLGTMPSLRGPRFVTEVLRMLRLWDEDWARRAAERVDTERIATRLRHMLSADLKALPGLLTMLLACDAEHLVDPIVAVIEDADPDHLVRRLDLEAAPRLLLWLQRHGYGHADVAECLARAIGTAVESFPVRDEVQHWVQIGWAAAAVRRVGATAEIPLVEPPLPTNRVFAAEVSWGLSCLPVQPWTRMQLKQSLDRLVGKVPTTPNEAFYTLVAASAANRTREFVTDAGAWSSLARMTIGQLDELQWIGGRDPQVATLLRRHGTAATERMQTMTTSFDDRAEGVEEWFAGRDLDDLG
ncbi:ATP-binding protein [Saccharothrix sp. 6-C]|uniref:ATP-binding protein n=1 Tax=Saccharothrix sp. 6-C TaxID=2781735 RepID=UPI001916E407|nr:ATP-binding protein [Saccharothrix sp. 6-C]QQQ78119.1 ATP-binding protein [Saccharothrix sp. 6-C]